MSAFRSFWFGKPPSPYERLAMTSFVDFGHSYTLYAYEKFDVPKGVELRDASEILPRSRVFVYKHGPGRGSVSAFSNLFRYRLLQQLGGWWVDADVICLSERVIEPDIFLGWEDEGKVGSAILRFPAGHPLMTALYDAADAAGENVAWGEIGPKLVTRNVIAAGLENQVLPRRAAFPILARDALDLLRPALKETVIQRVRDAPLLHYWNEVLRRAVVFKWMAPPPDSYLACLFEKHGVARGAKVYSDADIERLETNFSATLHVRYQETVRSLHNALAAEEDRSRTLEDETRALRQERDRLSLKLARLQRSRVGWTDRLRQTAIRLANGSLRPGGPPILQRVRRRDHSG